LNRDSGVVSLQVPSSPVSVFPVLALPLIVGGLVFTGAGASGSASADAIEKRAVSSGRIVRALETAEPQYQRTSLSPSM
jgi:hypothetical protein